MKEFKYTIDGKEYKVQIDAVEGKMCIRDRRWISPATSVAVRVATSASILDGLRF